MRARWVIAVACFAVAAASVGGRSRAVRAKASVVSPAPRGSDPARAPRGDSRPSLSPTAVPVAVATTTLTGATVEPDIAVRLDAIESAVRDGDLAALPTLAASDLAAEPEAAPAIIRAVASLAAQGGAAEQALAGRALARWLREESKRGTRDASGNVVNLVEALGDLGGDAAVDALVDALDRDGALDLALQTTTAQRLGALGDKRALPAIERFAGRVAKLGPSDDAFERELEDEARAAAAEARALLGK